jgi:hypothetical protein
LFKKYFRILTSASKRTPRLPFTSLLEFTNTGDFRVFLNLGGWAERRKFLVVWCLSPSRSCASTPGRNSGFGELREGGGAQAREQASFSFFFLDGGAALQ